MTVDSAALNIAYIHFSVGFIGRVEFIGVVNADGNHPESP